jgi:Tfp pilus assembly protein PilN
MTILLIALLVALLGLLVPAWQWFTGATASYAAVASEGERLREGIGLSGPAGDALDALATEAFAAEERAGQLESALGGLALRRFAWSDVLPVLVDRAPEGISITAISDQGDSVLLSGLAMDEALPLAFARNLSASGPFVVVQLEVIDRLGPDTEATPTTAPTPRRGATPTPTATPSAVPRFTYTMTLVVQEGPTP